MTHISIGVTDNCKNPESYGTICVKCNMCGRFDKPKQTNADRIRAMSDEELAKWLAEKLANQETMKLEEDGYTPTATQISALCARLTMVWLDWLKQEEHHER